ncbi:MAG: nucleotide sugar dehydrogenase [candidate division WOR-3 bacterium]
MLEHLIKNRRAKVGIIGLGYVGLPLAIEVLKAGFEVLGVDVDKKRVLSINRGSSYIDDVSSLELTKYIKSKKLQATVDYRKLKTCDIIIICVPTPVNINKEPDLKPIIDSTIGIKKILHRGQLIILKSTTFPETTEKVVLPILRETGLKVGRDFYLSFCPERIDPGNKKFGVANTPVVIGGITKKCTNISKLFYSQFVEKIHPVSSARAAEMTKLLENTFRNVNIALVNEFAQLCERMGNIDIWEVIDAAKTKPFGFMPFYPGPGVGGHCIPVDPYYLSYKAREYDFHTVFIELSARINEEMPYFVVNRTIEELSKSGVCPKKAKVLLLGMAFKKDISDLRHSPALRVYEIIKPKVARVRYHDPYVPRVVINDGEIRSIKLSKRVIKNYDAILILTDHSNIDYDLITKNARLIIDTRNAIKSKNPKVRKLGVAY